MSVRRLLVVPLALVSALELAACGGGAGSTAAGSGARASTAAATTTSPAAAAPVSAASTPSPDANAALPTDERLLDLHNCQDPAFRDPAFRHVYADFCNGGGAAALAAGHPMVTEGPVTNAGTSFVQYGDGLRVEILSATKQPTAPGESYFDSDHPNSTRPSR